MKSFEFSGYFWLPAESGRRISEIPKSAIPGTVSFDPATAVSLELLGSLNTTEPFGGNPGQTFAIVQGMVKGSGECVTLRDCLLYSTSAELFITSTKLVADCVYFGHRYWFDSIAEIRFDSLTLSYTYLNDWMFQKNIQIDVAYREGRGIAKYDASYIQPKPITAVTENAEIEIWSAMSGNSRINEESIKDEYRISITPRQPLHFDEYLNIINFQLRSFFTLATGQTNHLISIGGKASEDRGMMSAYFRQPGYKEKQIIITSWQMLFEFADVEDELPKYLSNWIALSDKLQPVIGEFFYVSSQQNLAVEVQFLALTRALEGYHRIVCNGQYLTPEAYKPIKEALIGAIPCGVEESHRDKLKGMLKYGYEYSLRKRLKDICDEVLADNSVAVQGITGKPGDFSNKITQIRNVLTHPDVRAEAADLSASELLDYVRKMQMLLRICFLKEMGFAPAEAKRLLLANQEYQSLTGNSAK